MYLFEIDNIRTSHLVDCFRAFTHLFSCESNTNISLERPGNVQRTLLSSDCFTIIPLKLWRLSASTTCVVRPLAHVHLLTTPIQWTRLWTTSTAYEHPKIIRRQFQYSFRRRESAIATAFSTNLAYRTAFTSYSLRQRISNETLTRRAGFRTSFGIEQLTRENCRKTQFSMA